MCDHFLYFHNKTNIMYSNCKEKMNVDKLAGTERV